MNDMTSVIIPKSDQMNADDLIAGPRTITVREVTIRAGTEQPVSIFYNGDDGKPYKTCKSMNRVLVAAWGADANVYVGRSMTLYRDDKVKWGGMAVGGIRISHMTDIKAPLVMALTETKGSKKMFTVQPMKPPAAAPDKAADGVAAWEVEIAAMTDMAALEAFTADETTITRRGYLKDKRPELASRVEVAIATALERLSVDTPATLYIRGVELCDDEAALHKFENEQANRGALKAMSKEEAARVAVAVEAQRHGFKVSG